MQVLLKEMRARRGISQNELARRLKMSLANIQKIEYNRAKSVPFDTLDRLCCALDCEVEELLVRDRNLTLDNQFCETVTKTEKS